MIKFYVSQKIVSNLRLNIGRCLIYVLIVYYLYAGIQYKLAW